jgi:hypothetical protein
MILCLSEEERCKAIYYRTGFEAMDGLGSLVLFVVSVVHSVHA